MQQLLLIEDDPAIIGMLTIFLEKQGFAVTCATDANAGMQSLYKKLPDCVIVDWMLPDVSGPHLIRQIRRQEALAALPVLMLTAKSEEVDKVNGLESGADDYLTKPVALKELLARIRALLRRAQRLNPDQHIAIGRLEINPATREVFLDKLPVAIAGKEFDLLALFMKKPYRLFSRAQLLDQIWGQSVYIEERTVDVHIMRLRKALKAHGLEKTLATVRGSGYRLDTTQLASSLPHSPASNNS
jgi:two-component system phosphate regulon response regulator PhoB